MTNERLDYLTASVAYSADRTFILQSTRILVCGVATNDVWRLGKEHLVLMYPKELLSWLSLPLGM